MLQSTFVTKGDGYIGINETDRGILFALPGICVPFSVHITNCNNVHNSAMSRNFRKLVEEVDVKHIKALNKKAKLFLKEVEKVNTTYMMTDDDYLSTKKNWGSMKKQRWRDADGSKTKSNYTTTMFIKNEENFKTPDKAGRLINCPARHITKRYGKFVQLYTNAIKKNFKIGSTFNKCSPNVNLIWTSGMNRNKIGATIHEIIEFYNDAEIEYEIFSADYSKFEATQSYGVISNLIDIYGNTTTGLMQERLVELCKLICGTKFAYVHEIDSFNTMRYKFKATRTSGDPTTTVGNTLLAMFLADAMCEYKHKKLVYVLQAGDDGLWFGPKGFSAFVNTKMISDIGMKLDIIHTTKIYHIDYNSSYVLRAKINDVDGLYFTSKIGRILAKAPIMLANRKGATLGAYIFQKADSICQEVQLFPGVHKFYRKVQEKYDQFSNYKNQLNYKDLVTCGVVEPTNDTVIDICSRYNLTQYEFEYFNKIFGEFDPNILYITEQRDYLLIKDTIMKFLEVDIVVYDDDQLELFKPYFDEAFIQSYQQLAYGYINQTI